MGLQSKAVAENVLSDDQIVDLYWQRNEDAIKQTDIKYGKYLMTIAINIVHDFCDSEECLNDTYLGAWNTIPPVKPMILQAFLATIMRRTALNRYKANMRDKRIISELTETLSDFEELIADETDINEELYAKELGKIISAYLRTLTEREIYVFISRYYFAYPIDAIADKLGVSKSTVNKEIALIKSGLKQKLEREDYLI